MPAWGWSRLWRRYFPRLRQRCAVHFYRKVFSHVPNSKVREVAAMLKAIHDQESRDAAEAKAGDVVTKLKAMKLGAAAALVKNAIHS